MGEKDMVFSRLNKDVTCDNWLMTADYLEVDFDYWPDDSGHVSSGCVEVKTADLVRALKLLGVVRDDS